MAGMKVLVLAIAGLAAGALGPALAGSDGIEAVTRPSIEITLSFLEAGKIEHVYIKQGDRVKLGQPIIRLNDDADLVRLDQLKGQAENQGKIKMAAAQLAQKSQLLDHLEGAASRNAVSPLELSRAQLDASLASLTRDQESFEHTQAGLRFREAQIRLDRLALNSPAAGLVEELFVHEGQIIDRLEKVVRLVTIDPLWVDVATPVTQAKGLTVGAAVTVEFRDGQKATGKLVHVGAFADAGSDTLKVRIEVPNGASRPAGEHVKVRFP